MGQADPILTKLNAGPAVKKLVETALVLSNSQDPQQRSHAYSFMESAIKELEDDEKLHEEKMGMYSNEDELHNHKIGEQEDDEKENEKLEEEEHKEEDKEHKIHEEELSNHNQGSRTTGSEQSTDNTEPYPGEGKDTTTGEKPMQDMEGAVNQWNEIGGMPPGVPAGAPPGVPAGVPAGAPPGMQPGMNGMGEMPNGGGMIVPGLAPDIAQEMGLGMPQPPPMDTNQMMRQIQYTVQNVIKDYDKRVVTPMMQHIKNQRETLLKQKDIMKKLSREIQETKTNSGSLKLDLDSIKKNANAHFRETVATPQNYSPTEIDNSKAIVQPVPNQQRFKVEIARAEIEQMDRILNSNKNPMYN